MTIENFTVGELIEQLQKFDPNTPVRVGSYEGTHAIEAVNQTMDPNRTENPVVIWPMDPDDEEFDDRFED